MKRSYYAAQISDFLKEDPDRILGLLVQSNEFELESNQKDAWNYQIANLHENLRFLEGKMFNMAFWVKIENYETFLRGGCYAAKKLKTKLNK